MESFNAVPGTASRAGISPASSTKSASAEAAGSPAGWHPSAAVPRHPEVIKSSIGELRTQTDMIEAITSEAKRRDAMLLARERDVTNLETSLSRSKEELQSSQVELAAARDELRRMNEQFQQGTANFLIKKNELTEMQQELASAQKQLAKAKKELAVERADNAKSQELHRDLYEQAQRAVRDASRRHADLKSAEKDLAQRDALHKSLSRENASLSSEVLRLRQQVRAKTQQLSVVNDVHKVQRAADVEKMRTQISQLLEEKSAMIENIELLQEGNRKSESKIQSKSRKLKQFLALVQHQQQMLEEQSAESAILKGEVESARKDYRWQAEEREVLRERCETASAAVEQWKRKLIDIQDKAKFSKASVTAEKNSIEYECNLWQKKSAHFEAQLVQLQRKSATEKGKLAQKIRELAEANAILIRTMEADREVSGQLRKARLQVIEGLDYMRAVSPGLSRPIETFAAVDDVGGPLLPGSKKTRRLATGLNKRSPITKIATMLEAVSDDDDDDDDDASSTDFDDVDRDAEDLMISTLLDIEPDDDDDDDDDDDEYLRRNAND